MTIRSAVLSLPLDVRRANLPHVTVILIALSVVLGILLTDSLAEMLAYLLVTVASAAPVIFWIYTGAKGIPVFPGIAVIHFIYFGLAILRPEIKEQGFEPAAILSAAGLVALFLVVAGLVWSFVLVVGIRRPHSVAADAISDTALKRFMFLGLSLGAVYFFALYSQLLGWLGPSFGVFRAIAMTSATVASFMFGYARARELLTGRTWALAIGTFCVLVVLSMASLFLVTGILFCLAAVGGYVITRKRIPWIFVAAALPILIVLNAGKDEIRTKYWLRGSNSIDLTLPQIPGLIAEWAEDGIIKLNSDTHYDSVVDRASLLTLLIQVKQLAPDYVPFLDGASYAVIPATLVPRFVDENKIASQAAMDMLNVHFGFLTSEQTTTTAVGWGLIAEGYGNFGYVGVVGVAFVLGLITGLFERLSDDAPVMSLPGLLAITAMLNFINIESDAAGLLSTLFQSSISIWVMFSLIGILSKRKMRLARIRYLNS
jgi:hypothetical protein